MKPVSPKAERPSLSWKGLYKEAALYQAALKLYTKALFQWRKALSTSSDGKTLYDFARTGLERLDSVHGRLESATFHFRAGTARTHNFNGKIRTLYIYPWEEKVVDLLLYRLMNAKFHALFSPCSYAYRWRGYGVDLCQRRLASQIGRKGKPLYLFKRDIARFFDSIDHSILLERLSEYVPQEDYLWQLLRQRVEFPYEAGGRIVRAAQGVPFGTPVACFFANLYLTWLDRQLDQRKGLAYFRYADDLIGIGSDPDVVLAAADCCDRMLEELKLSVKPSQFLQGVVCATPTERPPFAWITRFRHLGLEFRCDGRTGLSRDKRRKICNLFQYAFRRKAGRFRKISSPQKRAELAVEIARRVLDQQLRHVSIIDYYLRHVRDEEQLRQIDRWLAEEVLSISLGGHRRGHFRRISFRRLREMGLPCLRHRSRLIRHGQIKTSFFRWKEYQQQKAKRGGWRQAGGRKNPSLFPVPGSIRREHPVGEGGGLSTGGIEDRFAEANLSLSCHPPSLPSKREEPTDGAS